MEACLALIMKFEGFRAETYLCPAEVLTIGYGTTVYPNGMSVKIGDKITEAEAREYLKQEVAWLGDKVNELIVDHITITENQLSALVCFSYNLGLESLKRSTLLKKLNSGTMIENVAEEFKKWVYANGIVMQGLVARREAERRLFLGVSDKDLQ